MYGEKLTFYHHENKIEYAVDFPENYQEGKAYPVLIYLHGYGFVNASFGDMLLNTPVQRAFVPEDKQLILVTPHCPYTSWILHMETLRAFVRFIAKQDYCNPCAVYLAGTSMGGCSAWALLLAEKEVFAGAIICCAEGQYWASEFYQGLPILVAHGEKDEIIYAREGKMMVKTVNERGGNATLKLYPNLGHEIWNAVFSDPETYAWLFRQQKT